MEHSEPYESVSVTFTAPRRTIEDLANMYPDSRSTSEALRSAILEVRLHRALIDSYDSFKKVDRQGERFFSDNNK